MCTLGVAPGRSRGIGGCARAPCVSLAPAEGTARGCAGMWRGNPVLLRNWWSCPGPASASAPGPASESETGFGVQKPICRYPHFLASAADALQDSRGGSARVFMTEALGSRPAPGTPSAKRSVGTRRAASMQHTLSEGTARAAQLAPSAVTASAVGGSATRGVVGRVSPTTSGSSRSTREKIYTSRIR